MAIRAPFDEVTAAEEIPKLIQLTPNLYAASFTLMKLIPARYILRKAAQTGEIGPDTLIVETTSGTFGLALAMQAARLGRRLVLVSDPAIDDRLYRRLTDLGAVVERVREKAPVGGYQGARLARLAEIQAENPDSFCPRQYSNPDNPGSYALVAELLAESLGQIDCVVGPVGSGGSMCGTVGSLRSLLPHCRAIGVDTPYSVLFGQPDGHRGLRGLGNSLMPQNLDHQVFDSVHWCSEALAYQATRRLHQRFAMFKGPTSGAAFHVAHWWSTSNPDSRTVVMLPDDGYRYQDTVYDDTWLRAAGHLDRAVPGVPVFLDDPRTPYGEWSAYEWGRRTHDEVISSIGGLAGVR
ncbi:pyridoxal-phosphate dependent enzyme [Micromonospora sagamiensis]|uniref:Cysteine synthase A n=1 Tax=Micromonospora sagamiensis TaxID=47875 RepID=A0A562WLV9_9ACTN|nr:pyridoxal-phosphate dependent enzyme [Micromonospora sagamiensis]TWJ31031.1 cysteine synthase A [Micromonospora sagamiensis]BCL15927.1 cystathionine beta-synthase [Micromonospora sagamiensis]